VAQNKIDVDQKVAIPKNNPKTIGAWAFFDWANSAYSLVITVAIFPPYFYAMADDQLKICGIEMSDTTLFSWSVSLAYLIIAGFSPILSGLADSGGRKMYFMQIFTTLGAFACMSMLFFTGMSTLWLGVSAFVLSTIGFAGGVVFNNAFLPLICTPDQYDSVSAKGFIYGFIGSVILLLTNLLVILNYEWFGFATSTAATPVAFVMVGLWWILFAQIPFRGLPKETKTPYERGMLSHGFKELRNAWQLLRLSKYAIRFLTAFFLYNAAVQAVLFLASTFADKELHFALPELIGLILVLQIVAVLGAWLFSRISRAIGNRLSIGIMLLIWTVICFLGYLVQTGTQFYVLASGVGLVMGGIQSLSRSTYAKFLPKDTSETTSFFSFYDVMDKTSTVFGTFLFGVVDHLTGNMRLSILAMAICFLLSMLVLYTVRVIAIDEQNQATV
jgi:MFS transporter, UMF1 family